MNINLKQWLTVLILAGLTLGTQGVLAEESTEEENTYKAELIATPMTEVSVEVETVNFSRLLKNEILSKKYFIFPTFM